VSLWPSVKAKRLLAALIAIGWTEKRRSGSHRILEREGWANVVFAFHDRRSRKPQSSPDNQAQARSRLALTCGKHVIMFFA
jgi:predicted RNA binding protein YcfA (HicA-like mRNA interferase family)